MFSAKKIKRFQFLAIVFIILGYQLFQDQFYLIPSFSDSQLFAQWRSVLWWVREQLITSLNNSLTEPHASFTAGIILGARESTPKEIVEAFRITGTSHLVAVSGYNVTVVAYFLSFFLVRLGLNRKQAFWVLAVGLINFALLTGAQAAVNRAAIMGILVLFARHVGRPSQTSMALFWAALAMLIINPGVWKNDIGFQLSFMATMGLVYYAGYINRFLPKLWPDIIKESISSTLSATLFSAPIIIYYFGRFSLSSIPANLLVLPAIPLLMLFGATAMFLGLLHQLIGQIPGLFAWGVSSYVLGVIKFFSHAPNAELSLQKANLVVFILYLFIFFYYFFFIKNDSKMKPLRYETFR